MATDSEALPESGLRSDSPPPLHTGGALRQQLRLCRRLQELPPRGSERLWGTRTDRGAGGLSGAAELENCYTLFLVASELELKFSLAEEQVPSSAALRGAFAEADYEVGQPQVIRQHDCYYDDARLSLARDGLALRRRLTDGQLLATVKARGRVAGPLHLREELELPIEDKPWPDPISLRVSAVTDPGSLRRQIEIETVRVLHTLSRQGAARALLSFDAVEARRPQRERSVRFNEVEIEARGDTTENELFAIAELLERFLPLTASDMSKLERAQSLLVLGVSGD